MEVRGRTATKTSIIPITKDPKIVFESLLALFVHVFGDKFGEKQAEAFTTHYDKDITKLLTSELMAGTLTFHTVIFDDQTSQLPLFYVNKEYKLNKDKDYV